MRKCFGKKKGKCDTGSSVEPLPLRLNLKLALKFEEKSVKEASGVSMVSFARSMCAIVLIDS